MGKLGTSTINVKTWYELLSIIENFGVEKLVELRNELAELDSIGAREVFEKGKGYNTITTLGKVFTTHDVELNLGLSTPVSSKTVGIATLTECLNKDNIKRVMYNVKKLYDSSPQHTTLALLPPSAFDRSYYVYPLKVISERFSRMAKFYTNGEFNFTSNDDKYQICSADNYDWGVYSEVKVENGKETTSEPHIIVSNLEFDVDKMPIYGEYTSTADLPEVELLAVPGDGTWKEIKTRYVLSKFYKGKETNR